MSAPSPEDPGFGVYVHWPFCAAKCPYCDFNSHVRERIDQTRFAAALKRELAWEAARLGRAPRDALQPQRQPDIARHARPWR